MVASKLGSTQWKTHTFSRSDHDYNNRCFQKRMGGGREMNQCRVSGRWSTEEMQLHINFLELKAVHFVLMTVADQIYGQNIQI